MREPEVHTPTTYELLVPAYLEFVRHHRGRRTTHQLEDALGRFCRWMTSAGLTDLHQLTPGRLRDFVASLGHFRPATIAVQASALRGWLGYLHLTGLLEIDLAQAVVRPRIYRLSAPPQPSKPSYAFTDWEQDYHIILHISKILVMLIISIQRQILQN